MKTPYNINRLEEELEAVYQSIQPGEAYSQKLRAELAQRTAAGSVRTADNPIHQIPQKISLRSIFARFNLSGEPWRQSLGGRLTVGIGMALILLALVFAVDTPSLLAQARAFFRFIPGVGFVENSGARALCAPVEVQEGDLNVKILAAGGSGRELHFSFSATYPSGERQIGYFLTDDAGNKAEMRGGGGGGGGGDGGPITMNGSGDFLLQSDSNHLVAVFSQSRPEGESLGEVRVPFELCPVTDPQPEEGSMPETPGKPLPSEKKSLDYAPVGVEENHAGIVLRVIQVSQNEKETGVQIQAAFDPAATHLPGAGKGSLWVYPFGMRERNMALTDDAGREYALQNAPLMNDKRTPSLSSHQFDPLAQDARRATLTVRDVTVLLEDEPVPFTFDPGGKARLGQVWKMSQFPHRSYDLAGFDLTFIEASYDQQQMQTDSETFSDVYTLTFKVKVKPPSEKMTLACVRINFADAITECSWSGEDEVMVLKTSFMEDIGERILTGNLDSVNVSVAGPWVLTWDIPQQ